MNRLGKILLGFGLLWYGVLRGAKSLVVRVQNYNFKNINLSDGTIDLNLYIAIKNPLLVGVTIKGVVGDVYAEGVKIGTVNTEYDYYIAGGRTHVLPVVVNLDLGLMGRAALLNLQSGGMETMIISFNGKILAGKYSIEIPLQLEMSYKDLAS